jgi:ABC-type Zn uptake system ZnuABC Zn-binding protein ZnuA
MPAKESSSLKVLAAETFLADIAQNVAGERFKVEVLMPIGVDPHGFEPTPQDVARVADSQVLIVNGAGFEEFLDELLQNAGGERQIIEASAGLTQRPAQISEGMSQAHEDEHDEHAAEEEHTTEAEHGHEGEAKHTAEESHHHQGDPHFWFDPTLVIKYVENIRNGLSQADPNGAAIYAANADRYIAQLKELDGWIAEQVKQVPPERRLLVTNHESLGYFADRYGFKVVGTIVPNVSPTSSPSAGQVAELIEHIKEIGAPAIFLETGANPQLADQVAKETGIKIETQLFSHSITAPDGPAPTYIDMMKYNTHKIVEALK